MKMLIIAALITASFTANAEFTNQSTTDKFTDESLIYVENGTLGFRCNTSSKTLMLTLDGRGDNFATPNSTISVTLRVDSGKSVTLKGRTFSNSYEDAYIVLDGKDSEHVSLLTRIAKGAKLLYRVKWYDEVKDVTTSNLDGSAAAVKYVTSACGVNIKALANVAGKVLTSSEQYDRYKREEEAREIELAKVAEAADKEVVAMAWNLLSSHGVSKEDIPESEHKDFYNVLYSAYLQDSLSDIQFHKYVRTLVNYRDRIIQGKDH